MTLTDHDREKLAAIRNAAIVLGKPEVGQIATIITEYGKLPAIGVLMKITGESEKYLTWETHGVCFGRWQP